MFKVLIFLTASAILATNLYAMKIKFKACKCFLLAHDLSSCEQCYIKPINRNRSVLNIVGTFKRDIVAPIFVSDLKLILLKFYSVFSRSTSDSVTDMEPSSEK